MSIYIEQAGAGPVMVMLHGWGANKGAWASVREQLAKHFSLSLVDLPGHGKSSFDKNTMQDMDVLADAVAGLIEQPAIWLGWSLGGMVAMNIAQRHPARVRALINVANGPRFLKAEDWPNAVDMSVLRTFSEEVQNDPCAALKRFIALQTRGSQTQREDARVLREALLNEYMAQPKALAAGLQLLERTDLRKGLSKVKCPVAIIAGENDTLHPPASMQAYSELLSESELHIIPGAGHAPFISHKNEFVNTVLDFVQRQIGSMNEAV